MRLRRDFYLGEGDFAVVELGEEGNVLEKYYLRVQAF